MLEVLFSLLGGVALVLIPVFWLSFAAEAEKGPLLITLSILSFFALVGALYLALSFWLFSLLPLFLLSSLITFFLWRTKSQQKPDFVVEDTLLRDSLSPDLQKKLSQELEGKRKK